MDVEWQRSDTLDQFDPLWPAETGGARYNCGARKRMAFFAMSHSTCMNLRTEHTKAPVAFAHHRLAHITTGIGGTYQRL